MKNIILFIIALFVFTGCSQKINIKTVEPAQVNRAADVKKITVFKFLDDNIGFSSKLETQLSKKTIFDKHYFTVVNRNEIDRILEEQRLQYSGLVDTKTAIKVGKLVGVEGIVSGEVTNSSMNRNHYRERRTRCLDKKCNEVRVYFAFCVKANYNLTVNLKLTDVQYGDIIYADSVSKNDSYTSCEDSARSLPSKAAVMDYLSNYIVDDFISKISPTKKNLYVELLDDPEIDYEDSQDDLLEYSLEYIKNGRLDKAEELLSKLLTSTNDKCYVAAYDLGVVKEAQGEYKYAKQLYDLADSLVLEPNKTIDSAILRINKQIENQQIVNTQIDK